SDGRSGSGSGSVSGSGSGTGLRPAQKDPTVDKAYDQIDHFLEGLKKKSLDINRTLDHHNVMIPEIASSVDRDQERIRKQQQEIKKRMR
ncbi:unnamed protein product, partial [Polarella glacialis]